MTKLQALSFHAVEGFLQNLEIVRAADFFACGFDPLFLQRVFGRAIGLVKHAEDSRERERRQLVRGQFVSHVMSQLVFWCAVPFLFLDEIEAASFARVGRIEHIREKFDAFAQAFDNAEALVIERALDHLNHVIDVRGVGARDEARSAGDQFFHRIDRLIDRAGGIGLALESDGRRRRGLLLGQAVDEVVHDEISHVDVFAPAVIDMIASDGESIAVAAEQKHMQIGPGEADARRQRDGAAMNVVRAVAVDEIRKTRRTTDACEGNDLFMFDVAFLKHLIERGQHSEISAAGTPGGVIGGDGFLGEFFAWRLRDSGRDSLYTGTVAVSYCCCFAHWIH
jgi:hypothetical protein